MPTRPLVWVAVGIGVTLILLAIGVTAGRWKTANQHAANTAADAADTIVPTTSPPPSTVVATTSPATTPQATVPPTAAMSPAQQLTAAKQAWIGRSETFVSDTLVSGVGVVDGSLIAASTDVGAGVVETGWSIDVWRYNGDTWTKSAKIAPDSAGSIGYSGDLQVADLTGDGSDEIFVRPQLYDSGGKVYQFDGISWNNILVAEDLRLVGGTLIGTANFCVPDCATASFVPYTYTWTGSAFQGQTTDFSGNPVTLIEERTCVGPLRRNDYEPLQLCDKGPAVRGLQEVLDSFGFLVNGSVDGQFGPDTATSVRLYQFSIGEPVTGIVEGQWYHELIEGYNDSIAYAD